MGAFSQNPWGVADTINAMLMAVPGARMGRAKDMGFTIDAYKGMNPYKPESLPEYNGLGKPINGTESRVPELITEGQGGRFYSDSPEVAERFAGLTRGGSVFPTKLRMENPKVIDAAGRPARDFQFGSDALKLPENSPHDGVILKNTKDEGTVFIPRYNNQARSPWARFDPANKDSSSLLASLAGLLGGGAVTDQTGSQ